MAFARFYGHFAAAYGTFWLVILGVAVLTQLNVNAGEFGLYGFPLFALLYAFGRMMMAPQTQGEVAQLRERVARLEGALDEARGTPFDPGEA